MKMKLGKQLALLALIPLVASCGQGGGSKSDYSTSGDHEYSLTIKNLMGKEIEGVTVELSAPGCKTVKGRTDKDGKVTIVGNSKEYNINVIDAPYSYFLDPSLTKSTVLPDEELEVKLSSKIIDAMPPKGKTYEVGELIFDTCGYDADGEEVYLSDLMEGKKAVMINFWYVTCSACQYEFPFLAQAYDKYQDDVAIMALDPFDDEASIGSFKKNNGFRFDMLYDADSLYQRFGVDGYPTSIMIDRYGFITFFARGAFGSLYEVEQTMSAFIGDDYVPTVQTEESLREKPDIPFPDSDSIKAVVGGDGFNGNFYGEEGTEDAEWSWPWVIDEKESVLKPANSGKQSSFATFYTDIKIQANQVLSFDYYCSTEAESDVLYILCDGMILFQISGEYNRWQKLYAYIPQIAGDHTLAFLYLKDSSRDGGQDTIKLKNFKISSVDDIDQPTYIYRGCAFGEPEVGAKEWQYYEPVVKNEKDGYYHVGTADGPLVLCNFLGTTNWDPTQTVSYRVYENEFKFKDKDYTDLLIQYANYSANNSYKLTPVTDELKDALQDGFNRISGNNNPNEWLEACYYYFACGKGATQIASPIHGLATFDCDEAKIGDNSVMFDYAPVLPRGKLMKFVPTQSGVYKFEGNNGGNETDCWLGQGENNRQIAENDKELRRYYISNNMDYVLYHYLEAGQTYYITSAFYDVLQTGRLRFRISFEGQSAEYLKLCSPGYEIGTTGPDGELDGGSYIVQVNARLAEDGFYHSVNRDGTLGDYIYAEWKYLTDAMNISLSGAIDKGGFNFGAGNDKTEIARSYNSKMITSGDKEGLVPVDKQLHDLLVEYMDFHGGGPGRQTWQRLCYYVVKVGK